MDISPNEAEQALKDIQSVATKTRRSIAEGGTYITLIITGAIWLVGFMATQFLPEEITGAIWTGLCLVGTVLGFVLGSRRGKRLRSPAANQMIKRVLLYWLLLTAFGAAMFVAVGPTDGKQAVLLVVLFIMLGQMSMGLIFSFSSVWWTIPVSALTLVGYFFFPDIYYLWMSILGGGGMIAYGLYIRSRW